MDIHQSKASDIYKMLCVLLLIGNCSQPILWIQIRSNFLFSKAGHNKKGDDHNKIYYCTQACNKN